MDEPLAEQAMEIVREEIEAIWAGMEDRQTPTKVFDRVFVPRFDQMYSLDVVRAGPDHAVEIRADGEAYGLLFTPEHRSQARILAMVEIGLEMREGALTLEEVGPGILQVR